MNPEEIARLPNPYDFANPVVEKCRFSGREQELRDIQYYLDQAARASQPINIALLGERAAGKTSLLNMIDLEARTRGMCVARVDLNESDAESPMAFFIKLFESVLTSACRTPKPSTVNAVPATVNAVPDFPFGGVKGKTYDTFLDLISSYSVPSTNEWLPFLFPVQFAKAMARDVRAARVVEGILKQDLEKVRLEAGRHIAILFDECNVLTANRVLLQILRNVFMSLPGYFLVFTGTSDLFPVMDEVFSPIVRQFKKIEVAPFKTEVETERCVIGPLEAVGVKAPLRLIGRSTIRELHREIAGGRPYEIQLVCHILFRRIQEGRATGMELDVDVLDEVLRELREGKNLVDRPLIRKLKSLSEQQLQLLSVLVSGGEATDLGGIHFLEYVFKGDGGFSDGRIREGFADLEAQGVLTLREQSVVFAGDDFDRIYFRYYARQRGVGLTFDRMSPDYVFVDRLFERFGSAAFGPVARSASDPEPVRLLEAFENPSMLEDVPSSLVRGIYMEVMPMLETRRDLPVVEVAFKLPRQERAQVCSLLFDEKDEELIPRIVDAIGVLGDRAARLGGVVAPRSAIVPYQAAMSLIKFLQEHGSDRIKRTMADVHYRRVTETYLEDKSPELSRLHRQMLLSLLPQVRNEHRNNLAYLFLAEGDVERAKELLSPLQEQPPGRDFPLPLYNFAVATWISGEKERAVQLFAQVVQAYQEGKASVAAGVVLVPAIEDARLIWREDWDPSIREASEFLLRYASEERLPFS